MPNRPAPARPHVSIRFSAAEIASRVDVMAGELAEQLPADTLVVSVLKGSFVFAADLIRSLSRAGADWAMDFLTLSSYGTGTDSSGVVRILKDLDINIEGRHVLVVEDIIDSGLTLSYLVRNLESRGPASVEVCALLTKPERREIDVLL